MTVHVGYQWTDAKGRTWEVLERLPFGMCRVATLDRSRVGEMSAKNIAAVRLTTQCDWCGDEIPYDPAGCGLCQECRHKEDHD